MYPVSDRFLTALRTSHQIVTHVDVMFAGETVMEDLAVQEASVTVDGNGPVRRRCRVTLAVTEMPDELLPLGSEIVLYRGVEFAFDDQELVPLGVFRIDRTTVTRPNPFVVIEATDRSLLLADDKLIDPMPGTESTVLAEIEALARDSVPEIVINNTATSAAALPEDQAYERERWEAMRSLADSVNAEVFFDAVGTLVIRDKPNVDAETVWTVGAENALVSTNTSMDRLKTFNGVVVEGGEYGETPLVGTATDDDPFSPTYWGGSFGRRPLFIQNNNLLSQAEVDDLAAKELALNKGLPRDVRLSNMVNPALDCGDVIQVDFVNGVSEAHRIDNIQYNLGPSSQMVLQTKTMRTINE
jgi:hypothetical protein